MKGLEKLLTQEIGDEITLKKKRNLFSQVYITNSALKKAYTYAEMVCDVLGEELECYGYLITPKWAKDRIVRDVYLTPNQEVGCADVEVSGESVIKAGKEISQMGYKVLGWWHSHAGFSTFHSGTDDGNMMKVLNTIAPTNYVIDYKEKPLLTGDLRARRKGNSLEVYAMENPDKKIYLDMTNKDLGPQDLAALQKVRVKVPVRIGFAYSIVVNALGSSAYSEIATKEFCDSCYKGEGRSKKTRLRIVYKDFLNIDRNEMRKEVKKKVKKHQPIVPKYQCISPFKKFYNSITRKKEDSENEQ